MCVQNKKSPIWHCLQILKISVIHLLTSS